MTAIVQQGYGSTDNFQLRRIDRSRVGDDEGLVDARAAGLDRGTRHLMTSRPYLMRLMGFGFGSVRKSPILGLEVAGTVVAVLPCAPVQAGRRGVRHQPRLLRREFAAARVHKLASKPDSLRFARAAAVPVYGMTALRALRDAGRVEAGQHVLVVGASGGVGTYAAQIAKAFGAHVTGVQHSGGRSGSARSARTVVDYTREDVADGALH